MPFHVYCIVEEDAPLGPCKVGVAANLSARRSCLQGGNWRQLRLAWEVLVDDRDQALLIERHILSRLRPSLYGDPGPRRRLKSEWLDASPEEAALSGKVVIDIFAGAE